MEIVMATAERTLPIADAPALESGARPDFKDLRRQEARKWILGICKAKGWTPTDLARISGVSPSTLCRFVNDETNTNNLSFDTISAVCNGSGVSIPDRLIETHGILTPDHARRKVGRGRGAAAAAAVEVLSDKLPVLRLSPYQDGIKPISVEQRRIPAPPELAGDRTAFAFQMFDGSLAPYVPERAMLYCTRSREIVKDDLVALTDRMGASRVGLCLAADADGITIEDEASEKGWFKIRRSGLRDSGIVRVISLP